MIFRILFCCDLLFDLTQQNFGSPCSGSGLILSAKGPKVNKTPSALKLLSLPLSKPQQNNELKELLD